jgi:hypothetical protein
LTDDGEELVDGVVSVYGYDFAAQILKFNRGFRNKVFEVYAQNLPRDKIGKNQLNKLANTA